MEQPPQDEWKLFIHKLNVIRRGCQSMIDKHCDEATVKTHLRQAFHALMADMERGKHPITVEHTQQMTYMHAHLLRGVQHARHQQKQCIPKS